MRQGGAPHHHVSLNAAKWAAMKDDAELRRAVRAAGTVAADGAPIAWSVGAERVPGIEVAESLLAVAAGEALPVALVGARGEVVRRVAGDVAGRGSPVVLARDGYFGPDQEEPLVRAIAAARPRLLLLALGTPRAERFAARWLADLGVPVVMGVGGAFDVWAGRSRRAPALLGRLGLEWAWRLAGSPRARAGRAVGGSARFLLAAARRERLPE